MRCKIIEKNRNNGIKVGNISYFCIVKQIKSSFNIVFMGFLLLFSLKTVAAESVQGGLDSVRVSLLTCGPGDEVWSYYGHTAIRVEDIRSGNDIAINYGVFSFRQEYFVLRFVFGRTDYSMGIMPMADFLTEYSREGRWVLQQDLNLTPEDKQAILQAVYENSLPQNVSYRYNYFYDNCTTRARDILVNNISGIVKYADKEDIGVTYRSMIHQWNGGHRWARFGNDLLLGVKADFKTDSKARQFLPDSLRRDFDNAVVVDANGKIRKLVSGKTVLIDFPVRSDGAGQASPFFFPGTPDKFFAAVFFVVLLFTGYELRKKCKVWLLDFLLLLISGTAGMVLLAMVFSCHPTVNVNFQILVLNPLSLFLLWPAVRAERKGRGHWYWRVLAFCSAACCLGAFFQDYAEGMVFVALSLLLRCLVNIRMLAK